jgi:hypothetical protein
MFTTAMAILMVIVGSAIAVLVIMANELKAKEIARKGNIVLSYECGIYFVKDGVDEAGFDKEEEARTFYRAVIRMHEDPEVNNIA